MSVKKTLSLKKSSSSNREAVKKDGGSSSKRRRYDSCFSFREISLEPAAAGSLKDMDSNELKMKIVRWAKAVAAYARQVSGKFGSSRRSSDEG
ncbi:2,3-bisphosphoglycerate-dependent phosphoglycerate mutase [Melia azedarach]|uniref:2,3-bisphosphoglycerate-dependent phosphoglycerate mutase n=1 Tax=Melia azedarach TaxID=155640 RepID=A0ACC1Y378_MELAZ|nr:2,3-bisphosphoglycerate-dependent phosphoglycerate mutase [Melia azedarach]